MNMIVKQLKSSSIWLKNQQSKNYDIVKQEKVNLLIQSCVFLLQQSPTNYKGWLSRNNRVKKIRGRYNSPPNNKALRDLVELTICDLEANASFSDVVKPWQLEDWPTSTYVCEQCGDTFGAKRKARFCSNLCRVRFSRESDQIQGSAA